MQWRCSVFKFGLQAVRAVLLLTLAGEVAGPALAQKRYDPGASDTEIRIGNIAAYSGPYAAYGAEPRAGEAYFRMVNEHGGVNGRRITLISVDGAASPAKSLQLAHQLVEQDGVLALYSVLGTEANLAVRSYANDKRVPQLFVQSTSSVFDDPVRYPWTMGFLATHRAQALTYAAYIAKVRPQGKIGVLYTNDAAGRESVQALHDGLGERALSMIVREAVFKSTELQTIDAQVESLQSSGADVFVNLALGPAATRAVAKAYDLGWHPLQFIPNESLSVGAFLDPAGLEKAKGIISNARSKGWATARERSDPGVAAYLAWMREYNPQADLRDQINVAGYERAQVLVEVLRRCQDDLTRANVMKQAASLDLDLAMLRPGIRVTTGPHDYQPIKPLFLVRFNGSDWVPLDGARP